MFHKLSKTWKYAISLGLPHEIVNFVTKHEISFIQKFITDNESDDYLVVGFPSQKSNPFREKSSCNVL